MRLCKSVLWSISPSVRRSIVPSVRLLVDPYTLHPSAENYQNFYCMHTTLKVTPSVRRLVGPLGGWSVRWFVGRSVGRSVGPTVHRAIGPSFHQSIGQLVHPRPLHPAKKYLQEIFAFILLACPCLVNEMKG